MPLDVTQYKPTLGNTGYPVKDYALIDVLQALIDSGAIGLQNLLFNGNGMLNQRGAAAGIADDAYDFDRWFSLTQTGTIAVSQRTAVADGTPFMMRMTQSQAAAQRMGRAQIIEGKNCKHLRGKPVTLTLKVQCSAAQAIRYAILEWTGSEDAVTSDVVNDWTSAVYAAGNFFLAANLTVLAVSTDTPAAATLETLTELSATLGSTFNNLVVLVWTEATAAQNVTLDLVAELLPGDSPLVCQRRSYAHELSLCQRYYEKSYEIDVAPGAVTSAGAIIGMALSTLSNIARSFDRTFQARKRATPTVTLYSDLTGTANRISVSGADVTLTTASVGVTPWSLGVPQKTGADFGSGVGITYHFTADAEL